jgi:hypothetical protein
MNKIGILLGLQLKLQLRYKLRLQGFPLDSYKKYPIFPAWQN